jgi:hypothetical protein
MFDNQSIINTFMRAKEFIQEGKFLDKLFGKANGASAATDAGKALNAAGEPMGAIDKLGAVYNRLTGKQNKGPLITNVVVPAEVKAATTGVNLSGRSPTSLDQVTHAYRNMSPAELSHAQQNGSFLPNPDTSRANGWETSRKFWSSGDAEGHFGRNWNARGDTKIRVPIDKVPSNSPVSAGHAEVFNKETGEWLPVISQNVNEDWNKANRKDKTDGLSQKAVNAYRRENPGSKLQTAVTTKPSKLKPGSKAAKRRKSFCARMSGNKGPMKTPKGKPTPKALALRRWNCESIEEMQELIMLGEQYIARLK